MLKISEVPKHIGERVVILDEGFHLATGVLLGISEDYKNFNIPYPIEVRLNEKFLMVPIVSHVAKVELIEKMNEHLN